MKPLKEATSEKHRQAEQMPFNMRMAAGELSKGAYMLYLQQQCKIFETLEQHTLPHAALARVDKIKADILELKEEGYDNLEVLKGTQSYIAHLNSLDEDLRMAHVYLNYLAQMFGGQMMKKVVPSSGKMYEFDDMREAMLSIRAIQRDEWADEVNKGFDFHIAMFADLEEACLTHNS